MFDPPGTDDKHEWIEVCNVSNAGVDLSTFKLTESASNHVLTPVSGGSSLGAGLCAVVADDAPTFRTDYQGFSGILFDSSFSLSNTGETLAIKDASGTDVDSTAYTAVGAKGDGQTLHRSGGSYSAGQATPGVEQGFSLPAASGSGDQSQVSVTGSTATPSTGVNSVIQFHTVTIEPPPRITLRVPTSIDTIAGTLTPCVAEVFNAKGSPVTATVSWNYGDGAKDAGASVRHAYLYDGTYQMTVTATLDGLTDVTEVPVTVHAQDVALSMAPDLSYIVLENKGVVSLDLTGWKLRTDSEWYAFPDATHVRAHAKTKFPFATMGMKGIQHARMLELISPLNDRIAHVDMPTGQLEPVSTVAAPSLFTILPFGASQKVEAKTEHLAAVAPEKEVAYSAPRMAEAKAVEAVEVASTDHLGPQYERASMDDAQVAAVSDKEDLVPAMNVAAAAETTSLPSPITVDPWVLGLIGIVGLAGVPLVFSPAGSKEGARIHDEALIAKEARTYTIIDRTEV